MMIVNSVPGYAATLLSICIRTSSTPPIAMAFATLAKRQRLSLADCNPHSGAGLPFSRLNDEDGECCITSLSFAFSRLSLSDSPSEVHGPSAPGDGGRPSALDMFEAMQLDADLQLLFDSLDDSPPEPAALEDDLPVSTLAPPLTPMVPPPQVFGAGLCSNVFVSFLTRGDLDRLGRTSTAMQTIAPQQSFSGLERLLERPDSYFGVCSFLEMGDMAQIGCSSVLMAIHYDESGMSHDFWNAVPHLQDWSIIFLLNYLQRGL